MSYRLSRAADVDLVRIYAEGFVQFGPNQADAYNDRLFAAFDLIASNPAIARERTEYEPPVRIHPVGAHVVIYVETDDGVLIVRVRHGREDWLSDPTE